MHCGNSNEKKNSCSPFSTEGAEKRRTHAELFGLGASAARLKGRADRENDSEYLTVAGLVRESSELERAGTMQGILQEQLDSIRFKL